MGRTHYDVLGITPNATPGLIRAAYRARIRDAHPDAGGDAQEAAAVNEAFQVLSDEATRAQYDQTLIPAHAYANADPSTPPPPTASYGGDVSDADPAPGPPHPAAHGHMPLWRRGKTLPVLGISAAVWLAVAVVIGFFAADRAAGFDSAFPALTGVLVAAGAGGFIIMLFVRARWWMYVAGLFAYNLLASSQGVAGYATIMLVATLAYCVIAGVVLRRARRYASFDAVNRFWAACDHPDVNGWFITRTLQDEQTCLVQLSDITGSGLPDTSAVLWGHQVAGTYVAADLTTSPGNVLVSVTMQDMKRAKKAAR